MTITNNIYTALSNSKACYVDDETGELRKTTFKERVYRFFAPCTMSDQDNRIAELLTNQLLQMDGHEEGFSLALKACSVFSRDHASTEAINRLKNVVFAHKCHQLISLNVTDLVDDNGVAKNALLQFLNKNHLHYAINKVNERDKASAIVFKGEEIFVRGKEGAYFLNSASDIDAILGRLDSTHPDWDRLQELRGYYLSNDDHSHEIENLKRQLHTGNYHYVNLNTIERDDKGVMMTKSYLAEGLETHHTSQWTSLKTSFIEEGDGKFHFRRVTHLPKYATAKSWVKAIYGTVSI